MNTDFTNTLPDWLRVLQRHRASFIAGIPITSILTALIIFAWFQYQAQQGIRQVRHTYDVRHQAEQLLDQVGTAEIQVKNYALTRQPEFLNSYRKSIEILPQSLDTLEELVSDNPNQAENFKSLKIDVEKSQTFLKLYLDTLQSSNFKSTGVAPLQKILQDTGLQIKNTREKIQEFIREEERLLEKRQNFLSQKILLGRLSMFVITGLGITGSIVAMLLMQQLDRNLGLQIKRTRAQERLFRDTFEQAAVGMGQISLSGKWLKVNQKLCEILGYSREELLKMRLQELSYPDDIYIDLSKYNKLVNQHISSYSSEKRYICKDGSVVWINLTVSLGSGLDEFPYLNGDSKRYGIIVIENITTRKEAELERDRFFDLSVDMLVITNREGQFKRVSPSVEKILGFTPKNLDQISFRALIHPDDLTLVEQALDDPTLEEAMISSFEARCRCKNGSYKWIAWSCVRISSVGLMYGTGRDITERKQTETAIERERQQLRQIITHAPVAMAMFDRELRYIAYSDKWLSDFGLVGLKQKTPLLGQRCDQVFPQMPKAWTTAFEQVLQGEIISNPEDTIYDFNSRKSIIRWAIHPWYEPNQKIGGFVIAADRIDELVEAREAALANARLKSQFLANMSHEIRTPMNGVMGMAGLLSKTELTPKQRDFVQAISRSADHLLAIINDILDFSKLEAGEMKLENLEFDLNHCLETVVDLVATQAEEKGLELAVLVDVNVPHQLRGDPGRLRQVLLNLIGNAIKFTAQGEVALRVHQQSSTAKTTVLRFEVSDTGIGISTEGQKKLFESFFQLDASMTRIYGGTGLGLAICKQLVHLMGGEIKVESQLGKGSKFSFTLRFVKGEPKPDRLVPPNLMDLKLLVVDRSATVRQAVRYLTQSWGMQLEEAINGESAIHLLRQAARQGKPYHVMIFDQQLLGENKENIAEIIRHDPSLMETKLVSMTMMNQRDIAEQMLAKGVSSYLIKPVRASHLFDALLSAMANQISSSLQEQRRIKKLDLSSTIGQLKPNFKILLAEDHPINQEVILNQLSLLGYEADLANNGEEALAMLSEKKYDIVFMDCQMPLLDGYATTQRLRQQEGNQRHTIVIALTAHALPTDREKCLAAGMDDYLSKPLEPEDLEAALYKWRNPINSIVSGLPANLAQSPAIQSRKRMLQEEAPLNLKRLQTISSGKKEFQQKLLTLYLERAETDLVTIHQALVEQDFSSLLQQAHRLKGSSGNIGATVLTQVATQLENAAKQQNLSQCAKWVRTLEPNLKNLKQFIGQYIES